MSLIVVGGALMLCGAGVPTLANEECKRESFERVQTKGPLYIDGYFANRWSMVGPKTDLGFAREVLFENGFRYFETEVVDRDSKPPKGKWEHSVTDGWRYLLQRASGTGEFVRFSVEVKGSPLCKVHDDLLAEWAKEPSADGMIKAANRQTPAQVCLGVERIARPKSEYSFVKEEATAIASGGWTGVPKGTTLPTTRSAVRKISSGEIHTEVHYLDPTVVHPSSNSGHGEAISSILFGRSRSRPDCTNYYELREVESNILRSSFDFRGIGFAVASRSLPLRLGDSESIRFGFRGRFNGASWSRVKPPFGFSAEGKSAIRHVDSYGARISQLLDPNENAEILYVGDGKEGLTILVGQRPAAGSLDLQLWVAWYQYKTQEFKLFRLEDSVTWDPSRLPPWQQIRASVGNRNDGRGARLSLYMPDGPDNPHNPQGSFGGEFFETPVLIR